MSNDNNVDIACKIVHETEKAWQITDDGKRKVWVPKSRCVWVEGSTPNAGIMTVPEWIAKDKGLI